MRRCRIVHQSLRCGPGRGRGGDIARAVLRLPGEAFTHRAPAHHVAETLERGALAGVPCALDELHDGAFPAIADHAQHEAESRGRFALPLAGMDDQQSLLGDGLGRDLGVLRRLALGHLVAMALVFFLLQVLGHGAFNGMASPATMNRTWWALTARC